MRASGKKCRVKLPHVHLIRIILILKFTAGNDINRNIGSGHRLLRNCSGVCIHAACIRLTLQQALIQPGHIQLCILIIISYIEEIAIHVTAYTAHAALAAVLPCVILARIRRLRRIIGKPDLIVVVQNLASYVRLQHGLIRIDHRRISCRLHRGTKSIHDRRCRINIQIGICKTSAVVCAEFIIYDHRQCDIVAGDSI